MFDSNNCGYQIIMASPTLQLRPFKKFKFLVDESFKTCYCAFSAQFCNLHYNSIHLKPFASIFNFKSRKKLKNIYLSLSSKLTN